MKRKSTVNRLYTRPVLTKSLKTPNELSFREPVNPLLKTPLENGQEEQTPLAPLPETPKKTKETTWEEDDEHGI